MDNESDGESKADANSGDKAKPVRRKTIERVIHDLKHPAVLKKSQAILWGASIGLIVLVLGGLVYNNVDKPKIVIILLAIGLTGIVWSAAIGLIHYIDASSAPAAPSATTSPATTQSLKSDSAPVRKSEVSSAGPSSERRIFIQKNVKDLLRPLREYTSIQAEKLLEQFIGKWVIYWGDLENVTLHDTWMGVYFKSENYPCPTLGMQFERSLWQPQLEILSRGDCITVLGRIKSIEFTMIVLDQCEITYDNTQAIHWLDGRRPKFG